MFGRQGELARWPKLMNNEALGKSGGRVANMLFDIAGQSFLTQNVHGCV